jgi:hypothetical protein
MANKNKKPTHCLRGFFFIHLVRVKGPYNLSHHFLPLPPSNLIAKINKFFFLDKQAFAF